MSFVIYNGTAFNLSGLPDRIFPGDLAPTRARFERKADKNRLTWMDVEFDIPTLLSRVTSITSVVIHLPIYLPSATRPISYTFFFYLRVRLHAQLRYTDTRTSVASTHTLQGTLFNPLLFAPLLLESAVFILFATFSTSPHVQVRTRGLT